MVKTQSNVAVFPQLPERNGEPPADWWAAANSAEFFRFERPSPGREDAAGGSPQFLISPPNPRTPSTVGSSSSVDTTMEFGGEHPHRKFSSDHSEPSGAPWTRDFAQFPIKIESPDLPPASSAFDTSFVDPKEPKRAVAAKAGGVDAPKNCVICGFPTNCYHYEVPACNACKAFFRRSVITQRRYVCRFSGACAIRSGVRCRSCRYDECLRAGMDARSIKVTADQADSFAAMINEVDRRKRGLNLESAEECEEKAVVPTKVLPQFEQTADARVVDFISYLELKFRQLRESTYNGRELYDTDVHQLLKLSHKSELGNADKYERLEFLIGNTPLFGESDRRELFDPTSTPPPGHLSQVHAKRKHWITSDLILNIEYCKALPFFANLDLKDQEALVTHVVFVNTVLVQSWYSFMNNSLTIVHPDGTTPLMLRRKKFAKSFDLREHPQINAMEIESFVRCLEPLARVRPDAEDYTLLKAIIFCHSETPGLSEYAKELLEKHRDVYARTLLHRLQAKLGTIDGARKYADLINLIQTFFHFAQRKRECHLYTNSMIKHRCYKEPKLLSWFLKNSSID
ncbi:Transcription factor HNF-4-like protein [Aphelenchoides fujianensis]|nr:Transcription factor HNF-4-like protein [Aphelenchoides fujianensis]